MSFPSRPTRRRVLFLGAALCVVTPLIASFVAATVLMRPVRRDPGPLPDLPPYEAVEFPSSGGGRIHGWLARGEGAGVVLLVHGVHGSRRAMLGRARMLHGVGYGVLVIDLQAHGASDGEHITFGSLESRDVRSAIAFLRERLPREPIAVIGQSLGGAACLIGPQPLGVEALVLEAVFPEIETAVDNRLRSRFGPVGPWLTPLLTWQLEPRLGVDPAELRPIEGIPEVGCAVLVLCGAEDERTTVADTRRLFEAAREPKELWLLDGAGHVDLYGRAPELYRARVLAFLEETLRDP